MPRDLQAKLAMAVRLSGYDSDIYQGLEDLKAMKKLRAGKAYAVVPGNPVPAAPVGLSPA